MLVEGDDPEWWWMEFAAGPERVQLSELHRYYAPNGMLLGERLALAADRLQERRAQGRSAAFSRQPPEELSADLPEAAPEEAGAEALIGESDQL